MKNTKIYIQCPHCNTYAEFEHSEVLFNEDGEDMIREKANNYGKKNPLPIIDRTIHIYRCTHCGNKKITVDESEVYPLLPPEPACADMPNRVRDVYNEAGKIWKSSPRCACGLLRLALEYLCNELDAKGNNLADKISNLKIFKNDGDSMNILRIVGNKAIHAEELHSLDIDDENTAKQLFVLMNIVVKSTISYQKEMEKFRPITSKLNK